MMNTGTTTEIAPVRVSNAEIRALEKVERIIEDRCEKIIKIVGKGNFDHRLMAGLSELESLKSKIEGLRGLACERAMLES